jgi:3-hydroxyisobutyrate dehydrogenase-like beta-hydroxyacid dehydrogenase
MEEEQRPMIGFVGLGAMGLPMARNLAAICSPEQVGRTERITEITRSPSCCSRCSPFLKVFVSGRNRSPTHHAAHTTLLATQRQPLFVYNRTASKAAALAATSPATIRPATSLPKMAQYCDIIHIMLSDDKACDEVITEIISEVVRREGGPLVIVNHTTAHPDCSRRAAAAAAAAAEDVAYVACPVFGR